MSTKGSLFFLGELSFLGIDMRIFCGMLISLACVAGSAINAQDQTADHLSVFDRSKPKLLQEVSPDLRWNSPQTTVTEESPSYDLQSLLDLAGQSNPTLIQAKMQISGELAKALQAGLYPNPNLSYVADNIGVEGTAGEFHGAVVQQRFVTANKLELSRSKYLQRAKVAEHLAVAQQFRVCNDVRVSYVNVLAAQRIVDLREELLKTAEDHLVTTKEMYNEGQANQVDVHQAVADYRREQLQVLEAENHVCQEFIRLTSLIGLELSPGMMEGELESTRELIDFDNAYGRILTCSPEILAAYAKLQEDNITIQRESVQWVPDLVISGGSGYDFETRDPVAQFKIQIEVPLYDRNQGTVRQAQADWTRQKAEIRRTELDLRMRLAEQYDTYISNLQQAVSYEETVLPESRAAYETSLKSYRVDREDWPEVLRDHREYTMRRIEQVANLRNVRTAEVLIGGYLLENGLQAPSNPTPRGHIDSVPKPR